MITSSSPTRLINLDHPVVGDVLYRLLPSNLQALKSEYTLFVPQGSEIHQNLLALVESYNLRGAIEGVSEEAFRRCLKHKLLQTLLSSDNRGLFLAAIEVCTRLLSCFEPVDEYQPLMHGWFHAFIRCANEAHEDWGLRLNLLERLQLIQSALGLAEDFSMTAQGVVSTSFLDYAIEVDNLDVFTRMLIVGRLEQVNPAARNWPLIAARYGSERILKCLLEKIPNEQTSGLQGEDSYAIDRCIDSENGLTPLHLAAQYGHVSCVAALTEKTGVDVNARCRRGVTALLLATKFSRLEVVRVLCAAGADVLRQDHSGSFPIRQVILNRRTDVLSLFEELKIEYPLKGGQAGDLIHDAILIRSLIILKYLVAKGISLNEKTSQGVSPILLLIRDDDVDFFKSLVNCGFDYKEVLPSNLTFVHYSLFHSALNFLDFLFKLNENDSWFNSAGLAHYSVFSLKVETLDFLHGQNISFDVTNPSGDTPLHLAVLANKSAFIEKIVSYGVNIDSLNLMGLTPLALAAHLDHIDTVRLLICLGANPNFIFGDGFSLMFRLADLGFSRAFRCLQEFSAEIITPNRHVNDADLNGNTALHALCKIDHLELVKQFVRSGADINLQNSNGRTPLFYAILFSSFGVIDFLVENGSDVKKYDHQGLNLLDYAAQRFFNDRSLECVQYLLCLNQFSVVQVQRTIQWVGQRVGTAPLLSVLNHFLARKHP